MLMLDILANANIRKLPFNYACGVIVREYNGDCSFYEAISTGASIVPSNLTVRPSQLDPASAKAVAR